MPGTESVTIHVFVGAGSRYETQKQRGISHFLEHMFFKGGKKYRSAAEVSQAIDALGGTFNAFTGKEYAGYFVKVAAKHVETACDVLSDMLLHATFPQEEAQKERHVIIEELRMYKDTPMYQAGWDFEELLYGDQPLGWDTIGTEETIRHIDQEQLQTHKLALYTPDNSVLVFAGKIDDRRSFELGQQYFGALTGKKRAAFPPLQGRGEEPLLLTTKVTEQAHLVMGVEGVSAVSEEHFAQSLLAIILGGNMSSRMFLRIREAKGLCYYINSSTDDYLDTGALSIRAGVDQARLQEAITAIRRELLEIAETGITGEELHRAKEFLKGKMVLALEESEEQAHFFGRQQLLYAGTKRGVLDLPDYFARIDAVTEAELEGLAARVLQPERLRLVVIGNWKDREALEQLL
jgi:predicted Zn-dependent peptidase